VEARALLDVQQLTKRYGAGDLVLRGVDLQVRAGECVVMLGSNGSGKSTLLRCIVGLHAPTSGRIVAGGNDLTALSGPSLRRARRSVAMVFQQARLVGRRSALVNVACGALGRHDAPATKLGMVPAAEVDAARAHLRTVGLEALAGQRAGTLSGGQAQRVSIARALAQRPAVILADEPVASLDPEAAEDVMRLLRRLAGDGLAVLCVLHQPDLAARHAHRIVGLRDGRIAFDVAADRVEPQDVARLYAGVAA
jgi:phosphonate transport system ATP-binding protein